MTDSQYADLVAHYREVGGKGYLGIGVWPWTYDWTHPFTLAAIIHDIRYEVRNSTQFSADANFTLRCLMICDYLEEHRGTDGCGVLTSHLRTVTLDDIRNLRRQARWFNRWLGRLAWLFWRT